MQQGPAQPESLPAWLATRRPALLVLAAALLFCLLGLGGGSLRSYDEAIYAQVAWEIVDQERWPQGGWLSTTWNGQPWYHKPPLALWATALAHQAVGPSELSSRLLSALSGAATVLALLWMGSRLFGQRVALVAALVLLSTPHFLEFSKMGMLDVPLTFWVTVSVLAYGLALRESRWLLLAGVAVACGFMTKGPAVLVAAMSCGAHLLLFRRFDLLRSRWLWLGGLGALVVVLPWHLQQWRSHGQAFVDEYLGYHLLRRGTEALEGHEGGLFFYVETLAKHQLPWLLLLPFALWLCARQAWHQRNEAQALVLLWAATVFGLYTLVATKLPWYLMAIYPALSLCVGLWLVHKVPARHFNRLVLALLAILCLQSLAERRIFDLDYSPEVKRLAQPLGERPAAATPACVDGSDLPATLFYAQRPVWPLDLSRPELLQGQFEAAGESLCLVRDATEADTLRRSVTRLSVSDVAGEGKRQLLRISPSPLPSSP